MTLLTYIFLVAIGAGVVDFSLTRFVRLQESVYRIAFLAIYFLFVIRYYYGADIYNYVPFYEHVHTLGWYLRNPDHYEFEHGFVRLCAVLNSLGLSYYWMTAVVTTFYFGVIAALFHRIRRHKTIALMALVLLDFNLIFAAHRQCVAVATFILMVMALDKRKYMWAFVLAYITAQMHKSGIFMAGMVWVLYVIHQNRMERWFFLLLIGVLMAMLVLPMTGISTAFVKTLPLPPSFVSALTEHLSLGRKVQVIWLLYMMVLVCMEYYWQNRKLLGQRGTEAVVIMGMIIVVLLYQYFYLLIRLRSYFLPLVIVYLMCAVQQAEDEHDLTFRGHVMLKEMCTIFLFAYFGYVTFRFEQAANNMHSNIYTWSTVFDLRYKSKEQIREERLLIAKYWWWYDYMKGEKNKVAP